MALAPDPPANRDFNVAELVERLWNGRLRVLTAMLVAGVVTLGIAFALPKWYQATAAILPPDDADLFSNLSAASKVLSKFPAFGQLGDSFTPADIFKATLKSRTIQETVADKYNLQKVYKLKSREKTLKELRHNYDVKLSPDGTILVTVDDRDPVRAADMANSFLVALDHFNIEKRNSRARRTREFLERRVHETDSLLRISEAVLRRYQEARHTVVPTSASSADVQSAAEIMGRKIALEVKINVLRTYLREDNDEIRQASAELEALKDRIATMPAVMGDVTRMVREEKIQEQVFVLLTAELEQARIREMMDTPTVQILDRAIPPERHIRPKRATLAIIAALLAFVGCVVFYAFQDPRRSNSA